jgi:hypothetical protein
MGDRNWVPAQKVLWAATNDGQGFVTGSGGLVIAVASNIRGLITNPAGSNKKIVLESARGYSSGGTVLATFRVNPTAGLPVTSFFPTNLRPYTGIASTATIAIDTSLTPMSGGIATGVQFPITNSAQNIIDDPWVLDPGQSLGMNITIPLALIGTLALELRHMEVTL